MIGSRAIALDQRRAAWTPQALLALLIGIAVSGGAYDPRARIVAATACLALAAFLTEMNFGRGLRVGALALSAPLLASAATNGWPSGWIGDAAVVAVGLSVAAIARTLDARRVIETVATASAVVATLGIAGVILHIQPWGIAASPWRVGAGLGYQNAAGAFLMIGFLASATLTTSRLNDRARVLMTLNAVALIATMSRGAGLAAVVGSIVLVRTVDIDKRPLGWMLFASAALVPSMLSVPFGAVVAIAGVGFALTRVARRAPEPGRLAVAGICVALLIAGIAGASALGTRTANTSNQRLAVWGATLAAMDHDLLLGTGPGTYRLIRVRDGQVVTTRHAHNEYIEVLSEQGVVGLAGLLLAVGALLVALTRAPATHWRALAFAVLIAVGIHASLDFILHIPAIVAIAAAVIGAGLPPGRRRTS